MDFIKGGTAHYVAATKGEISPLVECTNRTGWIAPIHTIQLISTIHRNVIYVYTM